MRDSSPSEIAMNRTQEKSLSIGYINLRAQTGFGLPKRIQVEQFLKSYKIDILHLQEAQIREDTFDMYDIITSNYEIIANNASNQYGIVSLVADNLQPTNIKVDTQGLQRWRYNFCKCLSSLRKRTWDEKSPRGLHFFNSPSTSYN